MSTVAERFDVEGIERLEHVKLPLRGHAETIAAVVIGLIFFLLVAFVPNSKTVKK